MTNEVRKSEYGYFELVERPTPDALKAYCAEKYYHDAEGSLAALARSGGWEVLTMMTDFPIDFSLANPLTNSARDSKEGKPCHATRVEIEKLMHAILPEKTVALGFG